MTNLIPQYREMAAGGASFRGLSILQHRKQIEGLVRQYKAKTLLDFGCGAGDAWKPPHRLHRELGLRWFDVTLHDPAFPDHEEKPRGTFDGVLCSDVLEHVPEADVDAFMATLFSHARKFVWASVCCRPAKKTFADGTNLHVTIQSLEWWHDTLNEHAKGTPFYLVETP